MTHVGAFIVPESRDENAKKYAFAIADSQATNMGKGRKRDNAQKLVRIGDNFLMGTGREDHIVGILRQLPKELIAPEAVSQQIMELGKKLGTEEGPAFIVVGEVQGEPQIWHADTSKRVFGQPDYKRIGGGAFDGSGIQETIPMIERDLELGLGYTLDLAEGFTRAYNIGLKAHRNLGCSDKLQVGLIGGGKIRTLYHPEVEHNGLEYLKTNFGFDTNVKEGEELDEPTLEKCRSLNAILNDCYHAMQIHCGTMIGIDTYATETFGHVKSDKANRDKHSERLAKILADRDTTKERVHDLVNTWLTGDVKEALNYLDRFDQYRRDKRSRALV